MLIPLLTGLVPELRAVSHGAVIGPAVYPSAVTYKIEMRNGKTSSCSGVFISQYTILTAAHCLANAASAAFETKGRKITSSKLLLSPYYSDGTREHQYDVGLVVFDQPAHDSFSGMDLNFTPASGEKIDFVGFGAGGVDTGYTDAMLADIKRNTGVDVFARIAADKRLGRNTLILSPDADLSQCLSFASTSVGPYTPEDKVMPLTALRSGTRGGDSGGPIFHENKVIGVISGMAWLSNEAARELAPQFAFSYDNGETYDLNRGTLLSLPRNKSFIETYFR